MPSNTHQLQLGTDRFFLYPYSNISTDDRLDFFDRPRSKIKSFLYNQLLSFRIFIFVLQFLFSGWDFSTDAFKGMPVNAGDLSYIDLVIHRLLAGFKRWDAVHMIHIAQYGYVFENSLAFFPLFPIATRVVSMIWATPFVHLGFLHLSSALLISAVMLNLVCFIIAGFMLYRITLFVSRSVKESIIAVLLFSVNPASIFFSAAYTESIYCLLTFTGILLLLENRPSFFVRYIGSLFCFGLAYATRSNGFANLGYIFFFCLLDFMFRRDQEDQNKCTVIFRQPLYCVFKEGICFLLRLVFAVIAISMPVYLHGRRQQILFCSEARVSTNFVRYAVENELITIGQIEKLEWCGVSSLILPPFYSYVQSRYWRVSFLGYWQFRKLPCFLMAFPAFFIVGFGTRQTWRRVYKYRSLFHVLATGGDHIPYTLHALFMAFGALFVYNSEVLTRVLFSSSPFPYIVFASWISDITPQVRLSDLFTPPRLPFLSYFCYRGKLEALLYLYLLSYSILGTAMHSMWLPFT